MDFKIEKNIEMPKRAGRPEKTNRRFPFDKMEVGDSFLVPSDEPKVSTKFLSGITSAVYQFKKMNKSRNFSCRRVEGGVRVWRTV